MGRAQEMKQNQNLKYYSIYFMYGEYNTVKQGTTTHCWRMIMTTAFGNALFCKLWSLFLYWKLGNPIPMLHPTLVL